MNGTTTEADDGPGFLGSSQSRVYVIYVVWLVILVVSAMAGGYTLGFLVDTESIGTAEDPNSFQVVDEWAGFTVANDDGGMANDGGGTTSDSDDGSLANDDDGTTSDSDDGSLANDDDGTTSADGSLANDDGMANTQSNLRIGGVLACDANAFCP